MWVRRSDKVFKRDHVYTETVFVLHYQCVDMIFLQYNLSKYYYGNSTKYARYKIQDTRIFINPTWGNSFPCSSLRH